MQERTDRSLLAHKGRLGSLGDSLRALVRKAQQEAKLVEDATAAFPPVNAVSVGMVAHAAALPEADYVEVARFEGEGGVCSPDD
jgi:hypothetical protein